MPFMIEVNASHAVRNMGVTEIKATFKYLFYDIIRHIEIAYHYENAVS